MKKIVVLLAKGFEETEAVVPIDILRRGGVELVVAGVDGDTITGAHGLTVETDCVAEEISPADYDGLVLPGGLPGADNLANSIAVGALIDHMQKEGKLIAAICASPAVVLSPRGILKNRKATGYPGSEFKFSDTISYSEDKVVLDGNIITSRGPGTAFQFGLKILEYLEGKVTADKVSSKLLLSTPGQEI